MRPSKTPSEAAVDRSYRAWRPRGGSASLHRDDRDIAGEWHATWTFQRAHTVCRVASGLNEGRGRGLAIIVSR